MKFIKYIAFFFITSILTSCGAYFNQPTAPQKAKIGELTKQSEKLRNILKPKEPIVVGVYNFKDQTGQYKSIENGSTFSTAVTQGATTILIKALEDSNWFRPIERENLGNLLNERNIIRSTREEYTKTSGKPSPRLKPLLFAGILLEGGIISYDTNILTGGAGARYFGAGGSTQYRQDRITIYLRAVSTSSGEILKTVYISKTILSQAVDIGLFRYVKFQRLLEAETGFTKNEPTQLAIQEAIEKAVEVLIVDGIKDKLWETKKGDSTEENSKETEDKFIVDYLKDVKIEESTGLYDRLFLEKKHKNTFNIGGGVTLMDGDYSDTEPDLKINLGYKYHFNPSLSLNSEIQAFRLNTADNINYWWGSFDLNLGYKILPHDNFSPFLYAGPGVITYLGTISEETFAEKEIHFKLRYGLGFEISTSEKTSIYLNGDYNMLFTDEIDKITQGKRDDYFFNFGIGINFHF